MTNAQTENGLLRPTSVGYIRTRPIPPGYDIPWSEVIKKGTAMYEKMRAELEAEYPRQYVVIDVVSGAYEIAPDTVTAARRLEKRCPTLLRTWTMKIEVPDNRDEARDD